jgi:hypothetical protein
LVGESNLSLEGLGHAIAMRGDGVDLTGGQPQTRRRFPSEDRKENPSDPIHRGILR